MKQPACIWLEHFAIQCLERSLPELRGQPVALFNGRQRIIQANAQARASDIVPGMRCKEATARLAMLSLFPLDDPAGNRVALRHLAGELLSLSPTVATWGSEEVLVDLAPSQHLHGGPEALLERLAATVTATGWACRIAAGRTLAGARLAARLLVGSQERHLFSRTAERTFLKKLPLAQMTLLPEFLQADREQRLFGYLGINTLGQLAAVPPHAVRETLRPAEQELLLYARQDPQLARHLDPVRSVPGMTVTLPFFPSITDVAPLLAHLEGTYLMWQEQLFRRRLLLARFDLVLITEDLSERQLTIPLSRPTRDPRLLLDVTRLKLADVHLGRPMTECRVEATELACETVRTRDLLKAHLQKQECPMDELRSRLDTRLGRRATLFTIHARPVSRPELGWQRSDSPEALIDPIEPLPAILPEAHEQSRDLPLLLAVHGPPEVLPAAQTEAADPTFVFEGWEAATMASARTEYFQLRWQNRPVLVRVRDRQPGEIIGLDD